MFSLFLCYFFIYYTHQLNLVETGMTRAEQVLRYSTNHQILDQTSREAPSQASHYLVSNSDEKKLHI